MAGNLLNRTIILLLAFALTASASLKIVGHNATIQVEKTTTSVLNRYKLGPKLKMEPSSEGLSISCELQASNSNQLIKPKIELQKLGDASSRPDVTSELSADKKTFRAKLTMNNAERTKASAYVCLGEDNGQKINTTIAFESVPLLSLSIEGIGYESKTDRETHAKLGDLPAIHGSKLSITCEVYGYPATVAEWRRIELLDEQQQELPAGKKDKLEFAKVDYYKDRGQYVCHAVNSRGKNSLYIYLRVKHPRAYLIPLIILLIELVIVVAIYVVYELSLYEKRWRLARHVAQEERILAEVRNSTISAGAGARSSALNTGAGARSSIRSSAMSSRSVAKSSVVGTGAGAKRSVIRTGAGTKSSVRISSVSTVASEVGAPRTVGANKAPGSSAAVKTQPGPSVRV